MNHFAKRALALALALFFTFTLSAGALAEGPEGTEGAGETTGSDETIPASASNVTVTPGTATLSATHIYVPFTIVNNSDEAVELNSVRNCNSTEKNSLFEDENSSHQFNKEIPAKSTKQILLMYRYEQNHPDSATYTLGLKFKSITTPSNTFEVYEDISVNFGINVGGDDAGGNNTPGGDTTETVDPPFRLSSYDAEGNLVPAPSGNAGKSVVVRIPLQCLRSNISNVTITPVLSTELDAFPFEITALDYTQGLSGSLYRGAIFEFRYSNLKFNEKVTAGVKKVDFTISWTEDWSTSNTPQSMTISIYVNVIKGYEAETGPDGTQPVSKPKVILDSYSISTEKIYAGEQFDVTFTLRNTSEEEAVQNIQISISDTAEVGKLMPANNGSNTLYIAKIGKGETHTETISMQSAPDTEAKAYTLQLDFSYEGASNIASYTATETIAIPILQRIRIKLDDPVIYDDPWVGQSCAIYFALYNMGKAPIYNCMVDVDGEGLAMEETYFGGTVSAGSTMRADFSIIPSVGGDIAGEIVITYEDVYGEQMEERLPLNLFVNEEIPMDDPGMIDPETGLPIGGDPGMIDPGVEVMGGETGGFPWVWVGIGVVVVAGAAVAIILLKKKRAKELEDV